MGQRTQLSINLKFIDTKGNEHIEREVYHYQWGGYSNYMFESLIPLFINARNYIFGVWDASEPEYRIEEYETALKGNRYLKSKNWLKKNFIDVASSSKNTKTSHELEYYLKDRNINQISEEEFYNFALNYQDCDNGRIVVDILISAEKCYCKWNFLKNDGGSVLKDLTKDVSEISKYWKLKGVYLKEFKKIIEFIDFSSSVNDGEKDIVKAEYDYEFFKKKFEKFEFKELK